MKELTEDILSSVQRDVCALNIPRYKCVFQATIGESRDQGVFLASRCLWDVETDNYAQYTYRNDSLYCIVVVFGLYLE